MNYSIPILITMDYKQQQMVNYENHQYDVQNELANLYEDIELISRTKKKQFKF